MARKELKRRPQRYEEIKGIGSTRAQELRNELGPLNSLRGSRNFLQNKLGQLSSGDRRNLPKFAENLISAVKGGDREAVEAVDSSLVREIESNNSKGIKSPQQKRKETLEQGNFDTSGDFGMASRFDEALEAFSEEYQGETTYTGPDPTAIREGVEESDAPEEFVGVVPSAVNQRTFLQFPTEENFEQNVRKKADQDDAIEPAKDAFVNFVDRDIGLGGGMLTVGEFEVSQSAQEEAREDYAERSPEAKQVDSRRRAPVTTNPDLYEKRPGELDFPGIDTPTESPKAKVKDYKRGGDFQTTDVDEESEVATRTERTVADQYPEGAAGSSLRESFFLEVAQRPGVAEQDFEKEVPTRGRDPTIGPEPSSERLPAPIRENLASGESADVSFVQAEQTRADKEKSQSPRRMDLPAGNPLDPSNTSGSQLVRNRETGDLFTVTEARGEEGEVFFENRENRDTFVGSLDQLRKFYERANGT